MRVLPHTDSPTPAVASRASLHSPLAVARQAPGLHLIGDLYGCRGDARLMTDAAALESFCKQAVRDAGLTTVGSLFHSFGEGAGVVGATRQVLHPPPRRQHRLGHDVVGPVGAHATPHEPVDVVVGVEVGGPESVRVGRCAHTPSCPAPARVCQAGATVPAGAARGAFFFLGLMAGLLHGWGRL